MAAAMRQARIGRSRPRRLSCCVRATANQKVGLHDANRKRTIGTLRHLNLMPARLLFGLARDRHALPARELNREGGRRTRHRIHPRCEDQVPGVIADCAAEAKAVRLHGGP